MAVEAASADVPAGFDSAPAFGAPIMYVARRGSVMLYVPKVEGAGDYRVFAMGSNVKVSSVSEGAEKVEGATISCAGLRNHNQCDQSEAVTQYGPNVLVRNCKDDYRALDVPKQVLQTIQLDDLTGPTTVVVEAVDALCPFPGAYGQAHRDLTCYYDGAAVQQATYGSDSNVQWRVCPKTFPVRTEAEIRADYGSLILNGQAPRAVAVAKDHSPWEAIGLPAENRFPKVLRRSVVRVEPIAASKLPDGWKESDFFESFSDANDVPKAVNNVRIIPSTKGYQVAGATLAVTSKLALYSYGADVAQWLPAQGTMRSVLADGAQEIMASSTMFPRKPFNLPDGADRFVHVTFETSTGAGERRYWWFSACGAAKSGETITDGRLADNGGIVPQPAFMNPLEGISVSPKGWNCLQIVPRGGNYEVMPGTPYKNARDGEARPETDLRIVINKPHDGSDPLRTSNTIVNVSPAQAPGADEDLDGGWMRQWNAQKKVVGVLLDDTLYVDQRVTFDVFFNRGRIVVYANGVQKVCNDFPNQRLSMAEAAIGLGHVLYHSSAERQGFLREDWLRTGMYQYLHNTPFLDQRSFDNFGVRQDAPLPPEFEEGQCYQSPN